MIPEELQNLDRWVCVLNGSKVPMKAFEYKGASVAKPEDWADYAFASQSVTNGVYDSVGFVFANDGYVGIDIDKGFEDDGFITVAAAEIIGKCESYTEISRSGRGFHIILKGTLPFDGRNNHKGVEIYQNRRYFITTGNIFVYQKISNNQTAIDWLLDNYFADVITEPKNREKSSSCLYTPVWRRSNGNKIIIRPEYPRIIEGSRNLSLTSLAGQLCNIGYSKRQLFNELDRCNTIACDPPLTLSEVRQIAESIMRYKRNKNSSQSNCSTEEDIDG